jgi:hypothetical protein
MTNATVVNRGLVSLPYSYSSVYQVKGKFSSIVGSNAYAENLIRVLKSPVSESFCQHDLHATFGQIPSEIMIKKGCVFGDLLAFSPRPDPNESLDWFDRVEQFCDGGHDDAALKEVSLATARFKTNEDFTQLSETLNRANLNNLPDVVLVALLRNTYSIRMHISSWNSLFDQIKLILKARNHEPKILLRGLKRST